MEPSCAYIDVAGLHADALARAKRGGAEVRLGASVTGLERVGSDWRIETRERAAHRGHRRRRRRAWADPIAVLAGARPLGIQAYRRTLMQLRTEPEAPAGMAHVAHIGHEFYFKPEAGGKLWLSPTDETPVDPHDVQPEELDVAIAIDRFEHVVDWRVTALERKWAGLRSFAPDRLPVYGFDSVVPGFFWCAGQGGFGIQTAPAAAHVAAALLLDRTPHPSVAGIDLARYAPDRFGANLDRFNRAGA